MAQDPRRLLVAAVEAAESVLDEISAQVPDRRDRVALSRAVERYVAAHGDPRFRVPCYRCGEPVVDMPLVYPSARGLMTWMPPAYLAARFNHQDDEGRRCRACGAVFPVTELRPAEGSS